MLNFEDSIGQHFPKRPVCLDRIPIVKFLKYKNAGVKEYWIIFPEEKKIMVYDFTKSDVPMEYSFKDSVPVGIWNGECTINFMEIYEQIAFMYHLEEDGS